jgi:cyanophycin synthetase
MNLRASGNSTIIPGRLQPGDLCLILIDQVEEALEHMKRRLAEVAGSGAA